MANEGYSAQVSESWMRGYNACYALYEDDKLEDCIGTAERELVDSSMPLFYRMKFLLLLGACLEDWYEVQDAVERCRYIWELLREHHNSHGTDERVEEGLAEVRQDLAILEHAQAQSRPEAPVRDVHVGDEDDDEDEESIKDMQSEEEQDKDEVEQDGSEAEGMQLDEIAKVTRVETPLPKAPSSQIKLYADLPILPDAKVRSRTWQDFSSDNVPAYNKSKGIKLEIDDKEAKIKTEGNLDGIESNEKADVKTERQSQEIAQQGQWASKVSMRDGDLHVAKRVRDDEAKGEPQME